MLAPAPSEAALGMLAQQRCPHQWGSRPDVSGYWPSGSDPAGQRTSLAFTCKPGTAAVGSRARSARPNLQGKCSGLTMHNSLQTAQPFKQPTGEGTDGCTQAEAVIASPMGEQAVR